MSTVFCNYIRRVNNEHISLSSNGKEMRDVSVVAGRARNRDAGQPAVLREGCGRACAMHGIGQPAQDARHGVPSLVQVGAAVAPCPAS